MIINRQRESIRRVISRTSTLNVPEPSGDQGRTLAEDLQYHGLLEGTFDQLRAMSSSMSEIRHPGILEGIRKQMKELRDAKPREHAEWMKKLSETPGPNVPGRTDKSQTQACGCREPKQHRDCAYCGYGGDASKICGVCKEAGIDGPMIPGTGRRTCAQHKNVKESKELDKTGKEIEKPPSRRGFLSRLAQEPVKQALAQQVVGHIAQQALKPSPPPYASLPGHMRALPHVAIGRGYAHTGSVDGVHSFRHDDGSQLEIHNSGWKHTSPDGSVTKYHESHGTQLASLDNHLEAEHNPKPEWFALKHLTPATHENTNFDAMISDHPEGYEGVQSEIGDRHQDGDPHHYLLQMDRNSLAPGSTYSAGHFSHPNFRNVMRKAGLAHMIPHATSQGYDDISLPFKQLGDAQKAAEVLADHVGSTKSYHDEYGGAGPVDVRHQYGQEDSGV